MAERTTHRADATALLDDRGYSGPLIRGQNPALLIEKAVRDRITGSMYWMEQCYGLNAASLCDRAVELQHVGGTYGGMGKPTPFLCLLFKMLQLVPDKEIVLSYLNWKEEEDAKQEQIKKENDSEDDEKSEDAVEIARTTGEFKYLRALAAFYIRLTWEPVDIYKTLEPLLADFRKIRRRMRDTFVLTHIDQFVDDLLTKDRVCATSLWKLPSRTMLEDLDLLEPRESPLGDEIDELDDDDDNDNKSSIERNGDNRYSRSPTPRSARSGDSRRSLDSDRSMSRSTSRSSRRSRSR